MDSKLERVLDIFEDINNIPRKSKHEEEISKWLCNWGRENGFEVETDSFMDVLIRVPATPGYEDRDIVVLQGHMDMVCEKVPESDHDFFKDPIKMYQEDGWLKAKDTSLGADNGIALAIAMALATDSDVAHPAMELIFTVDEETGLTGAVNLKPGWLRGKKLINIDSEDEGIFTIGCAGGRDAEIQLPGEKISEPGLNKSVTISVGGLKGGHSGVDIHLEKGNANIILSRLLKEIGDNNIFYGIADFQGGSAHNAIPRNSQSTITFQSDDYLNVTEIVKKFEYVVRKEYSINEPDLFIEAKECELKTENYSTKIVDLIFALPHGVLYNSMSMEGIVETSSNMAVVAFDDGNFNLLMSQRSSVMSRLDEISNKIDSVVKLAGAQVEFGGGYPAWQPDFNSKLVEEFKDSYREIFKKEPVIEVIHAGLECGVIGAKYPGMDMISIGPTIKNPHSPDEKMLISTVSDIWNLMVEYLKR